MFGKRIKLFQLFGFEVRLDLSWLIIALLVTWSLASGVFPYLHPGLDRHTYWTMGVVGALGLFVSIVAHEFCHSLVARRYGMTMKGRFLSAVPLGPVLGVEHAGERGHLLHRLY
jgi:Zn-dependent protease